MVTKSNFDFSLFFTVNGPVSTLFLLMVMMKIPMIMMIMIMVLTVSRKLWWVWLGSYDSAWLL